MSQMRGSIRFALLFRLDVLFEQRSRGVLTAEPESDGQAQHQRTKRDRKGGQHNPGREAQLLECHDDRNRNDQETQGATEQTGGRAVPR